MVARGAVFINCPFDEKYHSLLRPLLFTVIAAGYEPRIASERSDSGEARLEKVCSLIKSSDGAIHDLSRLQSESEGEVYRLNMAFELGLTYGYRVFSPDGKSTRMLVLETEKYRYPKSLLIRNQELSCHQG